MKKIGGYPNNECPTDMGTGMGQIFIEWIGYGRATTRTLPAPLTSLIVIVRPTFSCPKSLRT